jgi:hypothetical protein
VVGGQHEPVGTGDGNDKPKSRRRRCLGVAAEIEGNGLGKTRSFCMPFVPLAGGIGWPKGVHAHCSTRRASGPNLVNGWDGPRESVVWVVSLERAQSIHQSARTVSDDSLQNGSPHRRCPKCTYRFAAINHPKHSSGTSADKVSTCQCLRIVD